MRLLRLPHFKYKKYVSTFLFLLSFCIIFTTLFLKYTSNGVDAEFFAEAATNFFYNAKFKPVTEAFLLPEAGYLPLLQRIIAFFVVTIFDASAVNEAVALFSNSTQTVLKAALVRGLEFW